MATTPNLAITLVEQAQGSKEVTINAGLTTLDNVAFVRTGTHAAKPAAGRSGRLYLPNDGFVVLRDDGTNWVPFGPVFPLTEPTGSFAWVNQGSATITTTKGGQILNSPGAGAGTSLRIREVTAPATPWTLTALWLPHVAHKTGLRSGICFRNNTGGQIATAHFADNDLHVGKFTNATTFSADYLSIPVTEFNGLFVRIADDGVNRITSISRDGQTFVQVHSIGRTDFITSGADRVGFFVDSSNSATPNLDCAMTLLHWKLA